MFITISSNMTICCTNCLNDDLMDWDSTCCQCMQKEGRRFFLGLREDKSQKEGYIVVKSPNSVYKDEEVTVKDLLNRIQKEKEMKTSQIPMFGGTTIDSVYNSYNRYLE